MLKAYFKVLKNKNFLCLWLGQIVSQFGDRLTQIALIGLVYKKLGATAPSLGLAKIMFFTILPVFLVSPIAGVYVDRWDRKKVMFIADFVRGLLILFLGTVLINFESYVPVYIVIFLAFCVGRFFIPAKMAIIPNLVKKEDIFIANSLVCNTANIAAILGFGVGALIVEWWQPKGGLILDSGTFFLSSMFILLIRIQEKGRFHAKDLVDVTKSVVKVERSLFKEFKEGLHYLIAKESIRFSIKSLSLLFSFLGALYVVFIVFIQQTLGTMTKDLGFLAVWLVVGLFVGSLIYGKFAPKFSLPKTISTMLMLSSAFLALFVCVIKNVPDGVLASFFSFILGLLGSPIVIACNSLIHKKSEDSLWGRIFSSLEVVAHFSFVIFMFITAALSDIFSISPFSIIISVSIIISLVSLFSLFKNHDKSRREEVSPA